MLNNHSKLEAEIRRLNKALDYEHASLHIANVINALVFLDISMKGEHFSKMIHQPMFWVVVFLVVWNVIRQFTKKVSDGEALELAAGAAAATLLIDMTFGE